MEDVNSDDYVGYTESMNPDDGYNVESFPPKHEEPNCNSDVFFRCRFSD